jgi:hypothetical protein
MESAVSAGVSLDRPQTAFISLTAVDLGFGSGPTARRPRRSSMGLAGPPRPKGSHFHPPLETGAFRRTPASA